MARRRPDLRTATRSRLGASAARVRKGAWPVVQCAVAAAVAWSLAGALLGHDRPFFAAVAAVVCLGVQAAQRLRRVLELAVGVTIGVAVGDALVDRIGTGAWQIGLVVGIALLVALALDGGPLLTAQAGLQAVFVVALPRTPGGDVERWQDAMVGGLTALLIAAVLPSDPWRQARRLGQDMVAELSAVLRECADSVRRDDPPTAAFALARARGTQARLDSWTEALRTGHDVTQLTPLRRDAGTWRRQSDLASGIDRATRNVRVLVRRVLFALGEGEPLPPVLASLLEELADCLDLLAVDVDGDHAAVRTALYELAGRLDTGAAASISGTVVVAQLRSAVVDLLEGLGVDPAAARAAIARPS
jgi:uncharacterized membrane protein YgaE (UPF0421/DUF939 family)